MYYYIVVLYLIIAVTYGDERAGSMATPYDTIIIGLGSAGCTAASTLAQAGKRILALEAQDRIGGRVNTVALGDGVIELGAEWIHGTQNSRVYDLAIRNNVSLIPQDLTFEVYRSDGTLADKALINELLEYALSLNDDPPKVPEPFGQYATRRVTEYVREKHPHLLDDKQFLEELFDFLDLLVNNYEATNSWNDVTTESHYEELGGHQHMSWHKHGYRTFFEILLNTYNNGPGYSNLDIMLNKEVTLISWPKEPSQKVVVTCKDGSIYNADSVIVTVSLGVLKERHHTLFSPELPTAKITAIHNISMGVCDKVVLAYNETWWPRVTFMAFMWSMNDKKSLPKEEYWTTKTNGVSLPMGNNNSITFWICGDDAKLVETLPEELVKTKVMDMLRRFMGRNMTIPEPVSMLRSTWHSNPFTRGSYSYDNVQTPLYPNARSDLGQPLLDSAGRPRVLFAGEATDPKHFSTVHGAADTGYREATRLLPAASKL